MKPVVINNFLDKQSFLNLQKIMLSNFVCWNYNEGIDYSDEEGDKFQFTHNFYKNNTGPSSQHYGAINPILEIIRPKEVVRIKANLLTRTQKIIPNTFHTDIGGNMGVIPYTTAIFYVNSNNGYTEFENGAIVESEENRMVVFPAEMKHRGTSCTDKKIRVVINFNYLT